MGCRLSAGTPLDKGSNAVDGRLDLFILLCDVSDLLNGIDDGGVVFIAEDSADVSKG